MNSLFRLTINLTVLISLHRVKCTTVSSAAWSPIKVPLPADSSAIYESTTLEASKNGVSSENCKAICLKETEIATTEEVFHPNLCYDKKRNKSHKAWLHKQVGFIFFKHTKN